MCPTQDRPTPDDLIPPRPMPLRDRNHPSKSSGRLNLEWFDSVDASSMMLSLQALSTKIGTSLPERGRLSWKWDGSSQRWDLTVSSLPEGPEVVMSLSGDLPAPLLEEN